MHDGLTEEWLKLQKCCLGGEVGVTPRLSCLEREDEDGGKADHKHVGERKARERERGRVGQQLGHKTVEEAMRVGGAHPAGPILDDLQGGGCWAGRRLKAVERK